VIADMLAELGNAARMSATRTAASFDGLLDMRT
jgi:hypothetical protein